MNGGEEVPRMPRCPGYGRSWNGSEWKVKLESGAM